MPVPVGAGRGRSGPTGAGASVGRPRCRGETARNALTGNSLRQVCDGPYRVSIDSHTGLGLGLDFVDSLHFASKNCYREDHLSINILLFVFKKNRSRTVW